MTKIALIIGSLSRASINRTVAQHLAAQAPEGVTVEKCRLATCRSTHKISTAKAFPLMSACVRSCKRPMRC